MLATLSELPRDERDFAFEYKWDGVRAICYWDGSRLRLESRNLLDVTQRYPELWPLARALKRQSAVLDGEIVALNRNGRPDFYLLQHRMHVTAIRGLVREVPIIYMLFDVLYVDGFPVMAAPYEQRREMLERLRLSGPAWQTPPSYTASGYSMLAAARQSGLEGIVAKRLNSTYQPGQRGRDWLKVKVMHRQEFVIGGWTPGEGGNRGLIGSLLVGFYRPDEMESGLHYAGGVGTGFTRADHHRLMSLLESRRRKSSPFAERVPKPGAVFVEPELVAEVEFREWTPAGILRHPAFKGLRSDKPASAVVREEMV